MMSHYALSEMRLAVHFSYSNYSTCSICEMNHRLYFINIINVIYMYITAPTIWHDIFMSFYVYQHQESLWVTCWPAKWCWLHLAEVRNIIENSGYHRLHQGWRPVEGCCVASYESWDVKQWWGCNLNKNRHATLHSAWVDCRKRWKCISLRCSFLKIAFCLKTIVYPLLKPLPLDMGIMSKRMETIGQETAFKCRHLV